MNVGDLYNVWEVKALKKPGEDEARKILDRIAKQVQPIMRKHKWRVKVLSEFCPKNPSLLGLNVGGGVHVKLRLRRPNRDWDFIPFNQVLDTMLHELCHNAHGPHNASFYKLWDELRKECEELMAKGITGTAEGFDLPGRRLGGFSRQPPLSSLHQTALGAAQKRARLGSLLPSGPKRLGGDSSIMVSLSPIQAAAMAAERRFQDEIWCGSQSIDISGDEESSCDPPDDITCGGKCPINSINHGSKDKKEGYKSESSSSFQSSNGKSGSSFVDLTNGSSKLGSTHDHDTKSRKRSHELDSSVASQSFDYYPESSASPRPVHNLISADTQEECAMWECGTCTLLNPPLAPLCKLCGTQKPKDTDTKFKNWFCKFCTLENSVKLDKCSACEQWRYSNGPPMSSRAPNLGT